MKNPMQIPHLPPPPPPPIQLIYRAKLKAMQATIISIKCGRSTHGTLTPLLPTLFWKKKKKEIRPWQDIFLSRLVSLKIPLGTYQHLNMPNNS